MSNNAITCRRISPSDCSSEASALRQDESLQQVATHVQIYYRSTDLIEMLTQSFCELIQVQTIIFIRIHGAEDHFSMQ